MNNKELEEQKRKLKEFQDVTMPVIKYLNENCDPHHTMIITCTHAELVGGVMAYPTEEFIKD